VTTNKEWRTDRVIGAVLKTDGAGNGMGFECARPPPTWKTNRAGVPAPLGKRLAPSRVCDSSSQSSAIDGQSTRRVPRARSKRDGCCKALGIKTSAVRQILLTTDVLAARDGVQASHP